MVSRFMRMFKRKTMEDDCLRARERSSDYIDGELDDTSTTTIREHLARCGPCDSFIKTLMATVDLLKSSPRQDAPDDFRQRIQERLNQERQV